MSLGDKQRLAVTAVWVVSGLLFWLIGCLCQIECVEALGVMMWFLCLPILALLAVVAVLNKG
jgi:hypothetical protein